MGLKEQNEVINYLDPMFKETGLDVNRVGGHYLSDYFINDHPNKLDTGTTDEETGKNLRWELAYVLLVGSPVSVQMLEQLATLRVLENVDQTVTGGDETTYVTLPTRLKKAYEEALSEHATITWKK